jgi:hypothetical protein
MCPPGHIALAKRAALEELRRMDGESAHA